MYDRFATLVHVGGMFSRRATLALTGLLFVSAACGVIAPEKDELDDSPGGKNHGETSCGVGQQLCSDVCTSVDSNTNCGACGVPCKTGQSCSSSSCVCLAGLTACGASCSDILADSQNCGGCDLICAIDELCSSGACVPASDGCLSGLSVCEGGCVDLNASIYHCGGCGVACGAGQACSGGSCGCAQGEMCDGVCTDTQSNVQHCGTCFNSCALEQTCTAGICTGSDPSGTGGDSSLACSSSVDLNCGVGGTGGSLGTGGAGTGGAGTGGAGTGGGGNGGSDLADQYPCDGSTSGYSATVILDGETWTARSGGSTVYTGSNMLSAMQAGMDSLSSGRTSMQSVLVQGSGSIAADTRPSIPDYTVLNVCGTINVTGSGSGDMAPIYARGRHHIWIPHVSITGTPNYGMFFRDVDDLHLGDIDLRLSSGEGIRIDNHGRSDRSDKVDNIAIDYVYVEGTGHHGVETYGVNNITIGTVIARDTTNAGLLLNDTTNADVELVDGNNVATGTGYAVFRMANRNGRIGSSYPTNIHVGKVIARGGGRGIFCVSESGGAVIDEVDIENTGNNPILLENCYNVTISATSGRVHGGSVRIAARDEFPTTSDVTFQNLTLSGGASILEDPCGNNNTAINISGGSVNMCN